MRAFLRLAVLSVCLFGAGAELALAQEPAPQQQRRRDGAGEC